MICLVVFGTCVAWKKLCRLLPAVLVGCCISDCDGGIRRSLPDSTRYLTYLGFITGEHWCPTMCCLYVFTVVNIVAHEVPDSSRQCLDMFVYESSHLQ